MAGRSIEAAHGVGLAVIAVCVCRVAVLPALVIAGNSNLPQGMLRVGRIEEAEKDAVVSAEMQSESA